MEVFEPTAVRIVWSRGKKVAKTQYKKLSQDIDMAVFDEKFQINTVLELNKETGAPVKQKISKMSVQLDKSLGGTLLAEAEFDMSDFFIGEYKP